MIQTKHIMNPGARDATNNGPTVAEQVITTATRPLAGCRGCPHAEKFRGGGCRILHQYRSPCFVREGEERREAREARFK
jgi:hypothetical protein